jgi:hypothetical protein
METITPFSLVFKEGGVVLSKLLWKEGGERRKACAITN